MPVEAVCLESTKGGQRVGVPFPHCPQLAVSNSAKAIVGQIKVASWRVEQLALVASELVKHDQPSPRSHF